MSILSINSAPLKQKLYLYNDSLCRWISPDSVDYLEPESINGLNLYCYCLNNPINYIDPNGHSLILVLCGVLASLITVTILLLETPNAETTKASVTGPEFFTGNNKRFTIVKFGFNGGRKDWYLDKKKEKSIFFSGFNFGIDFGVPINFEDEEAEFFSNDANIF